MEKKNIVIIPGLGYSLDIWKTTKTNQTSVFDYLVDNHNLIDLSIPISDYKIDTDQFFKKINQSIPNNSYILSNSFGCVISLIFCQKYPDKVKGMILIDPTTIIEDYRLLKISDVKIKNQLIQLLKIENIIKYLNHIPIISHVNVPFKKLMNPNKSISDENAFKVLNTKFMHLKNLSLHPKSNIIIHPNKSHFLQQEEPEKIKCNIDYLIN